VVELRPTTDGDLPALHATFVDAVATVFEPHGFDVPSPSLEGFSIMHRHVLETGVGYVAEDEDDVVGFAAAWTRGDDWFLASLFVRGRAQGRGVGPQLLDAVWGDARRRRTVTDAIQPVSNVLYGRRGLVPATPLLTFTGTPKLHAAAEEAPADLAGIDTVAYGFDRTVDHRYWERHARRSEWGDAYSYAFRGGDLGPVAATAPAAAARALRAELARAAEPVRGRIPGSARELVEVALQAGLRLGSVPGLVLLSPGVEPPTALAPSGYMLF
ncbi:MAG TPA: GNAT family N-acetyltransferase, partial [Gaiellaceae bacterium]|nr:GNAT family N-acetyltransferase [Gaiellaceae bacterium]